MAVSMAQVAKKQFENSIILYRWEFEEKKLAGSDEEKAGGGQASRPREGDFHAPPSPRWGTDGRSFAGMS